MTNCIKFESKYSKESNMLEFLAEYEGVTRKCSFIIGDAVIDREEIHTIINPLLDCVFNNQDYSYELGKTIKGTSFFERICEKITKKD